MLFTSRRKSQDATAASNRRARFDRICLENLEARQLLAVPVLNKIPEVSIPIGKPVFVPITASDADGDRLKYTVTSNSNSVLVDLHRGNPYLRLNISREAYDVGDETIPAFNGVLVFELFKDLTPKSVRRIAGLVQSGFYDGKEFFSLFNFGSAPSLRGGSPDDTAGGDPVIEFEKEFHQDALFTRSGQLALTAGEADNTNDSQFIISSNSATDRSFINTIIGQLVRGAKTLRTLTETPTTTSDIPDGTITITSAQLVENKTDAVVTVRLTSTATAADIARAVTVTVTDGNGGKVSRFIAVKPIAGGDNIEPVMQPLPMTDFYTGQGEDLEISVSAVDAENNNLTFVADSIPASTGTITLDTDPADSRRRIVLFEPHEDFTGTFNLVIRVSDAENASGSLRGTLGLQIHVGDQAIKEPTATHINTTAGQTGAFPVATFTTDLAGLTPGDFEAVIVWGDGEGFEGTINGVITEDSGTFTVTAPSRSFDTAGVYTYDVIIRQVVADDDPDSEQKLVGAILVDPVDISPRRRFASGFLSTPLQNVEVGRLTMDVARLLMDYTVSIDWGDGTSAEAGTIVPLDGQTLSVRGTHSYQTLDVFNAVVTVTDSAGNEFVLRPKITIEMPPVVVNAGADSKGTEGTKFTKVISFTDSTTANRWRVVIDYGDGSRAQGITTTSKTVTLDHTYPDNGRYYVDIKISELFDNGDNDDARRRTGADRLRVGVANVKPTLAVSGDNAGIRGQTRTIRLTAKDAARADNRGMFRYRIDWGDGSGIQTVRGPRSFDVSHTYEVENTYDIRVTATDKDGARSAAARQRFNVGLVELQPDPADTDRQALIVGGSTGHDRILLEDDAGRVRVTYGNFVFGTFSPSGRVLVFAGGGNDRVTVGAGFSRRIQIDGGRGNDSLTGGSDDDILLGGGGNDILSGAGGRDMLIGGTGADRLNGGAGEDILISDTTLFDSHSERLADLLAEWSQNIPYAQRVGHLRGTLDGGQNGNSLLDDAALNPDDARDILTGAAATDLFFFNRKGVETTDTLQGRTKGETAFDID